jgi:hypothetical protein
MKFIKNNSNPTYSNPLTIVRENSRFEVLRFSDGKVSLRDRKPRNGSRFWSRSYLVWDLKKNCAAAR